MAKQSENRFYRSCKYLTFLRMGIYREILCLYNITTFRVMVLCFIKYYNNVSPSGLSLLERVYNSCLLKTKISES